MASLALYVLDKDKNVVLADPATWEVFDRRVGETTLPDGTRISTVFLGIDHSFGRSPPLWFETMAFPKGTWSEEYCKRCSTWNEALLMHREAVEIMVKRRRGQ